MKMLTSTISIFLICHLVCDFVTCADWGYSGPNGPSNWSSIRGYEACGGRSQSPIDFPAVNLMTYDDSLKPFVLSGFNTETTRLSLVNNGHTAVLNILGDVSVQGGGLEQKYHTAQLHFHWSSSDDRGSEHTMNKMAYPLEMHIVNFNSKYDDILTAQSQPDGLAVLGFWFKITGEENMYFEPLFNRLKNVTFAEQSVTVNGVNLNKLVLPSLDRYFRYQGSLTTPPCYESVTWSVFEQTIPISKSQLEKFRKLYEKEVSSPNNHKISLNYRPVLALNQRPVTRSFTTETDSGSLTRSSMLLVFFILLYQLL